MKLKRNALIFGASGALGSVIYQKLENNGFTLFTAGLGNGKEPSCHIKLSYDANIDEGLFASLPQLEAVIWAQGINCNDSIENFLVDDLNKIFQSNVAFIASSQKALLAAKKLIYGNSRLVVVSSIWQLESRPDKLSYTISKSALQGLVKSCALDLGNKGILINAVLPGVVDTSMTRANLSSEQITAVLNQTAIGRLAEPQDIASAVAFLVGPENRAITGQFLTVDGGFTGLKYS